MLRYLEKLKCVRVILRIELYNIVHRCGQDFADVDAKFGNEIFQN